MNQRGSSIRKSSRAGAAAFSAVAVGLFLGGCTQTTTDKDIQYIGGAEVQRLVLDAQKDGDSLLLVLVDPRPLHEYEAEHIAGAWHLTLPMVPVGRAPEANLDRYDRIVVYGNDPGSATARGLSKRLIANGYAPEIYLFAGGLEEWKAQGGKTEPGKDTRSVGPR